jgi:hypothetical protein
MIAATADGAFQRIQRLATGIVTAGAKAYALPMAAAVAFCLLASVGLTLVLAPAERRAAQLGGHPWILQDSARLHVTVMAGLAGFAITGVVLLVGLNRAGHVDSVRLGRVVLMFVVAYLFYIGTAFLISYLPHPDAAGDLVPRIHFSLATSIEYRTVFLSWFALRPLLEVHHLNGPARALGVLLPLSLLLGSTIVAMAAEGLGLIRVLETYWSAAVATGLALALAAAAALWPALRSEDSTLAMTLVIFALNTLGFALAALTPLAPRYEAARRFYQRHGRRIVVADMQLTMLALTLLWLAVVGLI